MSRRTCVSFELRDGVRDPTDRTARRGVLRAATVRDEMAVLRDFRVYLRPEAFLTLMLARTIEPQGDFHSADVQTLQQLTDEDFGYLGNLYAELNDYPSTRGEVP